MQDTLRDDLLDFDIDEEETDAFLKKHSSWNKNPF